MKVPANNADPDQTAQRAVWSGSTLSAILSLLNAWKYQTVKFLDIYMYCYYF